MSLANQAEEFSYHDTEGWSALPINRRFRVNGPSRATCYVNPSWCVCDWDVSSLFRSLVKPT